MPQILHVLVARDARHVGGVIPLVDRIETGDAEGVQHLAQEAEPRGRGSSQASPLDHVEAAGFCDEALTVRCVGAGHRRDPELMHELFPAQVTPPFGNVALVLDLVQHDGLAIDVAVQAGAAELRRRLPVLDGGVGDPRLVVVVQLHPIVDGAQVTVRVDVGEEDAHPIPAIRRSIGEQIELVAQRPPHVRMRSEACDEVPQVRGVLFFAQLVETEITPVVGVEDEHVRLDAAFTEACDEIVETPEEGGDGLADVPPTRGLLERHQIGFVLDVSARLREDHEAKLVETRLHDGVDSLSTQGIVLVDPVVDGCPDRSVGRAVRVREVKTRRHPDRPSTLSGNGFEATVTAMEFGRFAARGPLPAAGKRR